MLVSYKKIHDLLLNLPSKTPIYIGGHIKPDQDSVCSCLVLAQFLNTNGKNAKVLLEDNDVEVLNWMQKTDLVCNKIDDKEYNFVALDLNEKTRLGVFENYFNNAQVTFNIDHHQNNKKEADYTCTKPGLSSTCEMIYNIIKHNGKQIFTNEICALLYAGILTDTNGFTRRLSKNTMTIAQKLINSGINYAEIVSKTLTSRSFYEMKALARLVDDINYDVFHYAVIDQSKEEFKNLSHNAIVKKIAEDLRKIEGLDVFVILTKNQNKITAKVMSNLSCNADKICELFGGGGHKKEAGFTTTNLTIEQIVKTIKDYLTK